MPVPIPAREPAAVPKAQITSIYTSIREGALILEFTAPDGYPRLTRWALTQIRSYMSTLATSQKVRGVVITGTRKCFAAGAELTEIAALDATEAMSFAELGQSAMSAIESSPKPVVAAVSGYCMGGGFDLALACRIRIASPDAVFAHRGATLGIMTGWGGTQRLSRILGLRGQSIASELMSSGRTVGAEEALATNLISKIAPAESLREEAIRLASRANAGANT